MTTKQIWEYYGLYKDYAARQFTNYKYADGTIPIASPDTYVGIELEIEELDISRDFKHLGAFQLKHDGSLRGNSIEAVTWPMKMRHVEELLTKFRDANQLSEKNYSDRTSVHVHVNMSDLTLDQVKAICLVYQTVERLLFTFIGEERENNIFCVPWYQAGITVAAMEKMTQNFEGNVRNWVKYTSLNLLPLRSQGTIEFRHLRGTIDIPEIITWINLIGCVVEYGKNMPYDELVRQIMQMNTVSNYEMFMQRVFGVHAPVMTKHEHWKHLLSTGVIDSKLMLVPSGPKKSVAEQLGWINAPQVAGGTPFYWGELANVGGQNTVANPLAGFAERMDALDAQQAEMRVREQAAEQRVREAQERILRAGEEVRQRNEARAAVNPRPVVRRRERV